MEKHSILIVDDDPTMLVALSHILRADYNLYIAKEGIDAVQVAKESKPDIILMDVIMPKGMGGYDAISALKSAEETKDIPVIFVTGQNDAKEEAKGISLGAADYINKPFNAAIVKLRVENHLEILRLRRELRIS